MKLFALLSLLLPPCKLKNKILNLFNHVNVDGDCYIGFSYIDVENLTIERCVRIKHFVKIRGLRSVLLKENSYIGNHNSIYCNIKLGAHGNFFLGKNSELISRNLLDVTSNINIGNNVVVGGHGSQFWTHGFDTQRNRIQGEIVIHNNVYIGSSTIFNLNVSVCEDVIIGAGSVVSKSINSRGFYAGAPASKKNDNFLIRETETILLIRQENEAKFFEKKL